MISFLGWAVVLFVLVPAAVLVGFGVLMKAGEAWDEAGEGLRREFSAFAAWTRSMRTRPGRRAFGRAALRNVVVPALVFVALFAAVFAWNAYLAR